MVKQHNKRSKEDWRKYAQLASWLLGAWTAKGKKPPTAGELMGEKKKDNALVGRMLAGGPKALDKPRTREEFLQRARERTGS